MGERSADRRRGHRSSGIVHSFMNLSTHIQLIRVAAFGRGVRTNSAEAIVGSAQN